MKIMTFVKTKAEFEDRGVWAEKKKSIGVSTKHNDRLLRWYL